ncbi:MAG: HEAT repeat domain-containing protein [Planctomycetaceae bacterium]
MAAMLVLAACGCGPTRFDQLLESAQSDDLDRQRAALRELADLGPEAAPAVPYLIQLSGHPHPDIRRLSGLALGNLASGQVTADMPSQRGEIRDVLLRQLDDKDLAVRNTAAFALLDLDPDQASAQRQLQRAIQQGDGGLIDRLTHLDPKPAWAVPTLIDIVKRDRRPGLRRLAVVALGEIDPSRVDAQQALKTALEDPNDQVRSAAGAALRRAPP